MSNQCQHILPSGERCRAHALRASSLCYFHTNLHRIDREKKECLASLPFAPIEDLHGIQLALTQVFNLLDNPHADTRYLDQMLGVLKLATRIACHTTAPPPRSHACPHCGHPPDSPSEPLELAPTEDNELLPTETLPAPLAPAIESRALPKWSQQAALPSSLPRQLPSTAEDPLTVP